MDESAAKQPRPRDVVLWGVTLSLLFLAFVMIFEVAPTEQSMGDVQRLMYVHVAVAWCGLAGLLVAGTAGVFFLWRRNLAWDQWARASAEVGWLCTTLTLITGSLWAHEAWGTWWTWDPRLTASLVLWLLYAGYFLVRGSLEDRRRQARLSAVVALVGMLDVPLVILATRWFRGMHPTAPSMPPVMRVTLLCTVVGFTMFFVFLAIRRRGQLRLADLLSARESAAN